ncbi:signal peptidase II [Alkalispirochaeta americana]|uniref:Lipoprotein signal peptidase n=1 Tax=Alkalispirochaeta americana TaxID=159291 RepID=A0A1N6V7S5_9SPIO|nr:signal peptidase II [Alkalispirochaeta americana]SIQ73837.1 signal peptidase II [Alkalispirochaeta americana]
MTRSYKTTLGDPPQRELLKPLILLAGIVILDQITKALVVATVPLYYEAGYTLPVVGDFFRILHVRNLGIAFSIGQGLPPLVRQGLFILLPVVVLVVLFCTFYLSSDLPQRQRWCVAAIMGGGVGNLVDRIFRPLGVVDFLDFKFYGILGMERWPAFNVADAAVVVGGIFLVLFVLLPSSEGT